MNLTYLPLVLCFTSLLILTGCSGEVPIGPGTTFDAPSASAIMLPPPTAAQQVNQGSKPWCAPAAGLTLYRMITGKNEPLEQVAREMKTTNKGTLISNLMKWLNDHEVQTSGTYVPLEGSIDVITSQIKAGYYVIPRVNESAKPNSPHVFIVYGVDGNRILISDSNRRLGMNRIGVDSKIFRDKWLNADKGAVFMAFANRIPITKLAPNQQKADTAGAAETPYGDLLVK